MPVKKRTGSPYWQGDLTRDGERTRLSLKTTDREEAEALLAKLKQDHFLEKNFGKIPEYPFNEALLSYAKYRQRENPRSFERSDKYRLSALQDWFGGHLLSEITRGLIREFYEERCDAVKPGTVYKDVSTLRAILNRAHDEERLATVPKFPKLKREKPRERWLTIE